MVQTRLAQVSDAPELKKLNDLFNGKNSAVVETIKKSLIENTQEIVCVAVKNNGDTSSLVGFCCGQIIKSMCYTILYGDITEFFVIDGYRNTDVGELLIKQIELEFGKRGVNHLHHLIGKDNIPMQELYISLGYANSSKSSYGSSSIIIFEKDTDKQTE